MTCNPLRKFLYIAALCCLSFDFAMAQQPMVYIYNARESDHDNRATYALNVLRAALERTRNEYGDFAMRPSTSMNAAREIHEMETGGTNLNVIFLASRPELQNNLIPVRVPIDRGLLGFRVFLIRAGDQARFNAVDSMDALKSVSIGLGKIWPDRKIFEDAGMKIVLGDNYESLFDMLIAKRFDALNRGVSEVTQEFDDRKSSLPGMAIEKSLLLYYPMPLYFWFPKTPEGELHARRVGAGMAAMVADGTLNKMFLKEYGTSIKQRDLKHRRLFRIENTQLGPEEPLTNAALWYDPLDIAPKHAGK